VLEELKDNLMLTVMMEVLQMLSLLHPLAEAGAEDNLMLVEVADQEVEQDIILHMETLMAKE
jgi:hypothetical protein